MSAEYAPRGFVGILAPQANTTVEPECNILFPAGVGVLNARLASTKPGMEDRLVDYLDTLDQTLAQFGGAPLKAAGVACTGASYLAGAAREDELFRGLSDRLGYEVTSSALTVVDALNALGAHDIALVSPYPDSLTRKSVGYWESRSFSVQAVAPVTPVEPAAAGSAHPIYSLGSAAASRALASLRGRSFDAIVVLGTGMPSLKPILETPRVGQAPVISCTLALAWRCMRAVDGAKCSADSLLDWVAGSDWRARFEARASAPSGPDAQPRL